MRTLKTFESKAEHEAYINSSDFIGPYVGYNKKNNNVYYQKIMNTGQILYDDNTISDEILANKLPVGICVIPSNFLPDCKARVMSLLYMATSNVYGSTNGETMTWGPEEETTSLSYFPKISTIDTSAVGSYEGTTISLGDRARLPYDSTSVSYSRIENKVDTGCYWNSNGYSGPFAPSPYMPTDSSDATRIFCNAYLTDASTNCLNDLDGEANTQVLSQLGSSYVAANACAAYIPRYSTNYSAGKFYLPAMGELGFMISRAYSLNEKLQAMISVYTTDIVQLIQYNKVYWSSTEYNVNYTRVLAGDNGNIGFDYKTRTFYTRAFMKVA